MWQVPLGRWNITNHLGLVVLGVGLVLSITSFLVFQNLGQITSYNDARAHLNMARFVVDNVTPGLAQMGSVWLPLQHLLILPFVWQDQLWQSGLAGSVISMISYILSGLVMYVLGLSITNRRMTSLLMTIAFLTNANALYMQAVPMTELLLLLFFLLTTLSLVRWVQTNDTNWLLATALSLIGATLTRYDGWFLLLWTTMVVVGVLLSQVSWPGLGQRLWYSLFMNARQAWCHLEGKMLLFITLASVGVVFWLAWNWVIFDDPLYFATGPYSARAQQERIAAAGKLPTAGNWWLSMKAYEWAVVDNIGYPLTIAAMVGVMVAAFSLPSLRMLAALSVVCSPFFFHVFSLHSGNSILVVPELGIHDPDKLSSAWFNVRYGLMMLPAAVIFGTYWLRRPVWHILAGLVIVGQSLVFFATDNVITQIDGTRGTSSLQVHEVAEWLKYTVQPGETILASIAYNNSLAFSTGLPLHQFIHEGTDRHWKKALSTPQHVADWIIMANGDVGDEVYETMIKKANPHFHQHYILAHRGPFTNVYQRLPFVVREATTLSVNDQPFYFIGLNSDDLLYRTPVEIQSLMRTAKQQGFTVVRFSAFGEGFADGLQPQAGIINQERARNLDHLLAIAAAEDIRVIPVLAGVDTTYGGIPTYLQWLGLKKVKSKDWSVFFSNPDADHLYRNYVQKIVNRTNSVNGRAYNQDPTILAWELFRYSGTSDVKPSAELALWTQVMTEYLRSLDIHQLVAANLRSVSPTSQDQTIDLLLADASVMVLPLDPENDEAIAPVMADWQRLQTEWQRPIMSNVDEALYQPDEAWLRRVESHLKDQQIAGIMLKVKDDPSLFAQANR